MHRGRLGRRAIPQAFSIDAQPTIGFAPYWLRLVTTGFTWFGNPGVITVTDYVPFTIPTPYVMSWAGTWLSLNAPFLGAWEVTMTINHTRPGVTIACTLADTIGGRCQSLLDLRLGLYWAAKGPVAFPAWSLFAGNFGPAIPQQHASREWADWHEKPGNP